jgi:hypothetical protein
MTSVSTEFCTQPFTKMQYHFCSLMAFTITKDMELRTLTQASLQRKRKQKERIQTEIKPLCYSHVSRVTTFHFFVSRSGSKLLGGKYVTYSLLTYRSFPSKDVGIKTQVML